MMMMTFITQRGEGQRKYEIRRGKLRKAEAEAWKRGLVARSCARTGRKDVVGEVKEKMLDGTRTAWMSCGSDPGL